jgi:hypothetical protein
MLHFINYAAKSTSLNKTINLHVWVTSYCVIMVFYKARIEYTVFYFQTETLILTCQNNIVTNYKTTAFDL